MGQSAVLPTKVASPRLPLRHVRRDRLIDAIESSVTVGRGVVLVSSPAGTGKTTLLSGWLETNSSSRFGETTNSLPTTSPMSSWRH